MSLGSLLLSPCWAWEDWSETSQPLLSSSGDRLANPCQVVRVGAQVAQSSNFLEEGVCELGFRHTAFREVKWGFLRTNLGPIRGPGPLCACCPGTDDWRPGLRRHS